MAALQSSSIRAIAGLLLALSVCASVSARAQTATPENKLKAAFVSKFPQFVEWPAAALTGRSTIDICVAPPDPFGSELSDLVAGETLNGRTLMARRVDRQQDMDRCQILFMPARAGRRREWLTHAAALPILTVGDDPRFLEDGGIVRLRTVDGRLRFDVNATTAQRVGLRISSQLLQLALTVVGGPP